MILKRCNNCHKLYEGKKCIECSKKYAVKNTQKRIKEDEGRKLYSESRWKKLRLYIISKYLGYDIWLLAKGQLVVAKNPLVHHIIERDVAPELIYAENNLICVSKESHEEIHYYYNKDKQYALNRIKDGIAKFQKLFGE